MIDADTDIAALEAELRAAQLGADVAALDPLISDDLLFTGPDGTLATKADDLAAYRKGVMRVSAHEPEELRVRRVGADEARSGTVRWWHSERRSSFFSNEKIFPKGSVQFDCALLMRGIEHEWHAREPLCHCEQDAA